jgi:hypothetical protein
VAIDVPASVSMICGPREFFYGVLLILQKSPAGKSWKDRVAVRSFRR